MSERARHTLADLVLAWTPFLVAFVVIPLAIYVPNQIEFEHDLTPIGLHVAVGLLAIIPLLALTLLKPETRSRVASGLFFLGLFVLVSDMIAPLHWGVFDGGEELREPLRPTLIQGALAILLIAAWYLLPAKLVRTVGVPLVCTLLLFQLYALTRASVETMSTASTTTTSGDTKTAKSGKLPNIYHLLFDGYSSRVFLDNLDALGLRDELKGFTFFPRNFANYPVTGMSVPSYMTGTFFEGGSLKAFQKEAKTAGLRGKLQDAGYRISIYAPNSGRPWMFDKADYASTERDLADELMQGSSTVQLSQIALVRVAPNPLRREVLAASNAVISRLVSTSVPDPDNLSYSWFSVPSVKKFIREERDRPASGQYVYMHVLLPHAPYVWDQDCQARQKRLRSRSGYKGQALCATRLIGEIISELKSLGRYDDSVIIIQSDHGDQAVLKWLPSNEDPPTAEVAKKLAATTNGKYTAKTYFSRLNALLLIKRPSGPDAALEISEARTQLADIPATVHEMLGLETAPGEGVSVFSQTASRPREIQVFTAHQKLDESGKQLWLGSRLDEIDIAHFGYSPETGWRVYPDVRATR